MGNVTSIVDERTRCTRCRASVRSICGLSGLATHIEIARISGRRVVAGGATILANGSGANLVGTVLAGVLKVSKTLPDGREQIVSLVYPGDFFGQLFRPVMEFAVEAATDVELCVADRLAYEGVLSRHPEMEHAMLLATFGELALARERSLLLSCQTTLERVATYLLVMMERREQLLTATKLQSETRLATLAITRADLAGYLGTTFETISRHIHYLANKGVISIVDRSHFEVLDSDRLLSIAGVSSEDLRLFRAPLLDQARATQDSSSPTARRHALTHDGPATFMSERSEGSG